MKGCPEVSLLSCLHTFVCPMQTTVKFGFPLRQREIHCKNFMALRPGLRLTETSLLM
jgi:hypothetical protein